MAGTVINLALYGIGLSIVMILFLPFSPMTIDLVNLPRDMQIAIYRKRRLLWTLADLCLGVVLLRGLAGALGLYGLLDVTGGWPGRLATPGTAWLWAMAITAGALALLFWSGYVPYVMAPPGRHRILAATEAGEALGEDDVVLGLVYDNEARAYPRDTIARPHYFMDSLAGTPMMISYCILCNSGIAFRSQMDGRSLNLKCVTAYNNNIIYHEPGTGNFIQQLDGKVFHGPDTGKSLEAFPVTLCTWGEWKRLHPGTTLYDAPSLTFRDKMMARMLQMLIPISKLSKLSRPWHRIQGKLDPRLPAMSFVLGVEIGRDACGYPVEALRQRPVVNDVVGGQPVALFYDAGRDLGSVFSRQLDSRRLTFTPAQKQGTSVAARDEETGTLWTLDGQGFEGPLLGRSLRPVPHFNKLFWFSWALFKPGTRVGISVAAA